MDDSQVSVVLAGGGTAGHVNPLLSIAAAIRSIEPHTRITVVGTAQGLESRLVPAAGFSLVTIKKVPFPRRPNLDALAFPGRWVSETRRVRRLLKDVAADVVVGVGGYAAAPAYKAGKKQGLPVIIHEQNAKAGLANKLGARWADFVGTVYDDTGITVRRGATLQRVGLPLRSEISHLSDRLSTDRASVREESARKLGLDPSRPIVVVTGGSLGAVSLNTAVSGAAKALLDGTKVQIYHLTGKGKADEVRSRVVTECGDGVLGRDYVVAEYLDHMEWALGCADLVICRSGAGTVSEIAALGLPAIYVPFPIGNGEQRFNAQPVVSAGGGLLVDDAEFTSTWVCEHVPHLLVDTARLETMRQKAWKYGVRDAAETMARVILERAHAARRSQYVK